MRNKVVWVVFTLIILLMGVKTYTFASDKLSFIDRTTIYAEPNTNSMTKGTLAPQMGNVKEKNKNWYLVQTYLGELYINPAYFKQDDVSYYQLSERTSLYSSKDLNGKMNSLAAQRLIVKEKDGDWYKVQSWLGDSYIYTGKQETTNLKQIQLLEPEYLYESNSVLSKKINRIGTQKVYVESESNGFFKIKTWMGDYYVYPKKYIDTKGVIKYRLDNTYHLYREKSASGKTKEVLSKQTIQVISENENWLYVSTWLGPHYINLNENGKVAFLTFDDGPTKYTSSILDILKAKNAKATFFMLEPNVRSNKELTKRMVNEGHYPGLHSVTHDKNKLYDGSPYNVAKEMNTTRKTVKDVTGITSNLSRVPYGSKPYMTTSFRNAMVAYNLKMWDWSIDSNDWRYSTSTYKKIIENVKKQVASAERNKEPIIILMHDREQTVKALPYIVEYLQSKGYILEAYNPTSHISYNFWDDSRL